MSRLFADPLPAHMEWNEGEPGSLRVGHRRLVVVEVVRRWRVDGEWWADGIAREYLTLRTADGSLGARFMALETQTGSRRRPRGGVAGP